MSSDGYLKRLADVLTDELRDELPPAVTDDQVVDLVAVALRFMESELGPPGVPERGLVELILAGFRAAGGQVKSTPLDELEVPPLEQIDPTTRATIIEILRRLTPDVQAPPNTYHVGVHADYIWIGKPWKAKMPKADALSLAVYLAYLADPEMTTFLPLLQAVIEK